jgi:hypothetical protein
LAALAVLSFFLTSCGEAPQPAAEKKAPPPEPVTGLTALYQMYGQARQWAPDAQLLRARNIRLAEVKDVNGKSGAWEATFVSTARGAARTFTYSVVEAEGNLYKGVFGRAEEGFGGPRGVERLFPINTVQVDSDKAWEIAAKKGDYFVKDHPKLPVFFVLEFTADQTAPVWRVVWGETIGTSQYSILVNGATGEFVKALR